MNEFIFSKEVLIVVVSTLATLIFSYFPKLNEWFGAKPENYKKLFILGLQVLMTAVIFAGGCFGWLPITGFVCDQTTVINFIWVLILGIVSNQGVYQITPQLSKIKTIKRESNQSQVNNKYDLA